MISDLPFRNITLSVGWRRDGGRGQWKGNLLGTCCSDIAGIEEGKEALHSGKGNGDGEEKMNLRAMSMSLGLIEYSEWWKDSRQGWVPHLLLSWLCESCLAKERIRVSFNRHYQVLNSILF